MNSINHSSQARGAQPLGTVGWAPEPDRDVSGYRVFSTGGAGEAHVLAHRLLDTGRIAEGHRRLGGWLRGRTGSGSEWVHLQFHMALFELELGYWGAAYYRFCEHILPAATHTAEALTDGPALLWRLALTAPPHAELPWAELRATALRNLAQPDKPFVELHNLLALAGAGDIANLDNWLRRRGRTFGNRAETLLREIAAALRDYAAGDFWQAADRLDDLQPHVSKIGGSAAQNRLFADLAAAARARELAAAA